MNIEGYGALVTGAASGLGAATAKALADAGAKVALIDLNQERSAPLAREIGGVAIGCDVSSAESGEKAVAEAIKAIGEIRILVNCAGIAPGAKIVGRTGPMPLEDFKRAVDINLVGTFNMIRLVAAQMMTLDPLEDGERGVVVNTASVAAFEGQVGQSAYAASKGGVVSLTLQAAREFASSGIRVCTIAPGLFETPMMAGMSEAVRENLASVTPFPRRLGRADEFASQALNFIRSVMLNGVTLRLDGALRMQPR